MGWCNLTPDACEMTTLQPPLHARVGERLRSRARTFGHIKEKPPSLIERFWEVGDPRISLLPLLSHAQTRRAILGPLWMRPYSDAISLHIWYPLWVYAGGG